MKTQIGIIGAGPAGLLLAQLLSRQGVESVVLEDRSRKYVEARIRAGILEQATVEVLTQAGVGERLQREGLRHEGINLQWPGHRERLDFAALCGRSVWAYGQTEVVKDLIRARLAAGDPLHFEVSDVALHDIETDRPRITYTDVDGLAQTLECLVIAGCDGSHGPSRDLIPSSVRRTWERTYPYAWLGILADVPPSTDELIYAWHPDGFALHSMRSPTVSRLYLQVPPDEDINGWSDDRIWSELSHRLELGGWQLQTGPILEKSVLPMRSLVSTPMRHGSLFLAGDAAHIVPPTGAKGLNLAVSDVALLARALADVVLNKDFARADAYSENALHRVWRATHFSWWMTSMLHPTGDDFDAQLQLSQLRYVATSPAAAASLAENYTGMPISETERAGLGPRPEQTRGA
jgi:p-hydroxybenzoate 3-monooxygenase